MANYVDYLAHFNYDVIFKPTKLNVNADYCSRAPLPASSNSDVNQVYVQEREEVTFDEFDLFIIRQAQQLPIRAENIARETSKDFHLGKILRLLESGQSLARAGYKSPELEYKVAANCLVYEHRVVIPPKLRQSVLDDLHTAHLGIVKMKGMARSFVYWPGIDADIERVAKSCANCAKHAHAPPKFCEHHWMYPQGPWERVHIDYAGPFAGKMLLIISDAYSKWLEVKITSSTTASATIGLLDEVFASYGVPVTIVSDNGTQFSSSEFKNFLQNVGVKYHKFTAPYHPSTNGQAERNVQTVKDHLKIMATTPGSLHRNLNEFLRQYRKAPHSTTGQSPAQFFLGRPLRTRLDLLKPENLCTKMIEKQGASFEPSFRLFHPSQSVYFLSGNPRMEKWVPGTIITRLGDLHYEIDFFGKRFKRHVDQIRQHQENKSTSQSYMKTSVLKNTNEQSCYRRRRYSHDEKLTTPQTESSIINRDGTDIQRGADSAEAQNVMLPVEEHEKLPDAFSPLASPTSSSPSTPPDYYRTPLTSPVIPRRSLRARRSPQRFSPS